MQEIALEHWDYALGDVLIHTSEVPEPNSNPLVVVSKLDIYHRPWIEMHVLFNGERKSHVYVVIEPIDAGGLNQFTGDAPFESNRVHRNEVMLVDVPKFVKSPKMLVFVVRVVIRLKVSDKCDCLVGESDGGFSYGGMCFGSVLVPNGEMRIARGLSINRSQCISQVVEGGAKTANKVAHDESCFDGWVRSPEGNNVLTRLNIVLARGRLGLVFNKLLYPSLECVKVYLRS